MRALAIFLMLASPAAAQDITFRSPTGNIGCMFITGNWTGVRCDLRDFSPSYRRPADCEQDWGFAFEVGLTGPGTPICAGDTVMDPGAGVLDYGRSINVGSLSCTSARTGMTCMNAQGHGFTVSRARQTAF
ncbi:MAG: hypothetical protein QM656_14700 [Paracoccaceae bacterium]